MGVAQSVTQKEWIARKKMMDPRQMSRVRTSSGPSIVRTNRMAVTQDLVFQQRRPAMRDF